MSAAVAAPKARRAPERRPAPEREKKEAPPLQVVPPRLRRRRAVAIGVTISVLIFAVMLGLTAFQTKIAGGQIELDRIESQTSEAQQRYQRLRLQVAQLESPDRIITAAKQQGMVLPATIDYVGASSDQVAAVIAAAGSATTSAPDPAAGAEDDWSTVKPLVGSTP